MDILASVFIEDEESFVKNGNSDVFVSVFIQNEERFFKEWQRIRLGLANF